MMYSMRMMSMRTTIDLPEAKHRQLKAISVKRGVSLGQLIAELSDLALQAAPVNQSTLMPSPLTGLLTLSVGRSISSAEVSALMETT